MITNIVEGRKGDYRSTGRCVFVRNAFKRMINRKELVVAILLRTRTRRHRTAPPTTNVRHAASGAGSRPTREAAEATGVGGHGQFRLDRPHGTRRSRARKLSPPHCSRSGLVLHQPTSPRGPASIGAGQSQPSFGVAGPKEKLRSRRRRRQWLASPAGREFQFHPRRSSCASRRRRRGEEEMKLKQLEGLLGGLTQFSSPKVELEQYATGPHIASRMLYTAENSFDDISGKVVADFGCGCGTLAVSSALLDAEHVIGIDIDPQSLELAQENAVDLELDIDLIQCDIKNLNLKGLLVDTVVMNPPFGTKRKGADMEFLSMGLKVASQAVYSLHKTSTREHIKKTALRSCNAISAEVLCELRYDLPQTYKFHRKKEVDIAVDLWRFVPRARDES